MDLYMIRHAEAAALGEGGVSADADRPLTEQGRKQAQQVGRVLHRKKVMVEKLVTSPLLRARQTAEEILGVWRGSGGKGKGALPELHVCAELGPNGKFRKLARALQKIGGARLALVGHLPHLAIWTAWLIGNKRVQLDLAKAGIAYVTLGDALEKGTGVLHWLVTPEWFD